jgi:hypothetical protein
MRAGDAEPRLSYKEEKKKYPPAALTNHNLPQSLQLDTTQNLRFPYARQYQY